MDKLPTITDPWQALRRHTPARIALGRAGGSLPTKEWLDFKLCHARARDAVHQDFDAQQVADQIARLGVATVLASSAADDRATYLTRPDLGRRLDPSSAATLAGLAAAGPRPDLVLIVSDGLSALAAQRHAALLIAALLPNLRRDDWRLAPVVIVRFGRVAIEDQVGELLGAPLALILLGERPGLNAPDSLGAYLVHDPRPGRTDAERNCVSNIRPAGLPIAAAAETLHYLLTEARRRSTSGIRLKDERCQIAGQSPATKLGP